MGPGYGADDQEIASGVEGLVKYYNIEKSEICFAKVHIGNQSYYSS